MREEKSKSVWKKSWSGWNWLRAWLTVTAATFLVILVISLFLPGGPKTFSDWLLALFAFLLAGAIVATIAIGVWSFGRWLCCWKNFRRFLFGAACLATLIALFYAEEDWRGWHDWSQYKSQQEAKGEKFDFKDFVPPPVSDDQNFAMAPLWVESIEAEFGTNVTWQWYGKKLTEAERTNLPDPLEMPLTANYADWPTNGGGNWVKATLTDLKPWQDYYRALAAKTNLFPIAPQPQTPAQDVLLALSKYNSTLEELRTASERPYSRFPLKYDNDNPAIYLLPHLGMLKRCIQLLELRSIAELQNGESDQALADIKLMLRLTDSIRSEPFLISHLVRIAMLQITLQPIYEGLAERKWSGAQLAELESELAKLDFLADYEYSMRGEMILGISDIEYLRRSQDFQELNYSQNDNHHDLISTLGLRILPASFFYRSELAVARMYERWTLPLADVKNHLVSPEKSSQSATTANKALRQGWPYNIFARMIFPAMNYAVTKFAYAQSAVDLARVGIALEHYRLAHGNYPDSLDALSPRFLEKIPHDLINGEPLHYRKTNDGQFVLYSVGWNETDDGGVVVFKNGSTPDVDISEGDWVWRYPKK